MHKFLGVCVCSVCMVHLCLLTLLNQRSVVTAQCRYVVMLRAARPNQAHVWHRECRQPIFWSQFHSNSCRSDGTPNSPAIETLQHMYTRRDRGKHPTAAARGLLKQVGATVPHNRYKKRKEGRGGGGGGGGAVTGVGAHDDHWEQHTTAQQGSPDGRSLSLLT